MHEGMIVETGLDQLQSHPISEGLKKSRVAVLAHHASVNRELRHVVTVLQQDMGVEVVRLFGPEHGLWSTHQDMEAVGDSVDPWFQLPVLSLYGDRVETLLPPEGSLHGVDIVVADLVDIGTRYYTYAATIVGMGKACADAGIPMVLLDRPNPISGTRVEGSVLDMNFRSFVGAIPVPHRHGLTMSELVKIGLEEQGAELDLHVLPVKGWDRNSFFDETGLPWVPPSPNMPTFETTVVYPGMCLLEATSGSEGRGTTTPFLVFGAPDVDPFRFRDALVERSLPGVGFRPHVFRPMFQKHAGRTCGGVQLLVKEPEAIHALNLGVTILEVWFKLFPETITWRSDPYEFVTKQPAIDLLVGNTEIRKRIETGQSSEALLQEWDRAASEFAQKGA
jgi:uncharacterized protein YbbC (DUF1343 family)